MSKKPRSDSKGRIWNEPPDGYYPLPRGPFDWKTVDTPTTITDTKEAQKCDEATHEGTEELG